MKQWMILNLSFKIPRVDDDDKVKVQVQNEDVKLDDDDKVEDIFKKVLEWMILELKWMEMMLILLLVRMVIMLGDFDVRVHQFYIHLILWLFKLIFFNYLLKTRKWRGIVIASPCGPSRHLVTNECTTSLKGRGPENFIVFLNIMTKKLVLNM